MEGIVNPTITPVISPVLSPVITKWKSCYNCDIKEGDQTKEEDHFVKDDKLHLLKCSKCEGAYYCSTKCQKEDWNEHKKICNDTKLVREESLIIQKKIVNICKINICYSKEKRAKGFFLIHHDIDKESKVFFIHFVKPENTQEQNLQLYKNATDLLETIFTDKEQLKVFLSDIEKYNPEKVFSFAILIKKNDTSHLNWGHCNF
jgi:hypothetical protein